MTSERTSDKVLGVLVGNIKREIKGICSDSHDSILLDNHEAVKRFSWETIWVELKEQVPTLMNLLISIVDNPHEKKPMLCLILSMILKARYSRMALVQRAVSLVLYGNGTSKQVWLRSNCYNNVIACVGLQLLTEVDDFAFSQWDDQAN